MSRLKLFLLFIATMSNFIYGLAQDQYMSVIMQNVTRLRKSEKGKHDEAVLALSATNCPKITLMDELKRSEGEYRGSKANKFKMNQVVAHVYNRQNPKMVSKGDFFDSREKDVHYSVIEKSVQKGATVTYKISGHVGTQEFSFIPFDAKTKYTAFVNGHKAEIIGDGIQFIRLDNVYRNDTITFSLHLDARNNGECESFVILNHNPQR